jgi:hypothetical protein
MEKEISAFWKHGDVFVFENRFEGTITWNGIAIHFWAGTPHGVLMDIDQAFRAFGVTRPSIESRTTYIKWRRGFYVSIEMLMQILLREGFNLGFIDWDGFSTELYKSCRDSIVQKKDELVHKIFRLQKLDDALDSFLLDHPPEGKFPIFLKNQS